MNSRLSGSTKQQAYKQSILTRMKTPGRDWSACSCMELLLLMMVAMVFGWNVDRVSIVAVRIIAPILLRFFHRPAVEVSDLVESERCPLS